MGEDERRLLEERKAAETRDFSVIRYALLACVLVLLGIVVPGWALSARETSRRVHAERSMLELAESLPGAVFQYRTWPDGRSRYELLSSSTEKLRGVGREAALRDPNVIFDTIAEPDRHKLMEIFAQGEKTMTPFTIVYQAKVGDRMRWIRKIAAPRRERDGSIIWSGVWDDVTSQHELEEELVRSKEAADAANRAKSAFLATMSHEIRTPMNGVLGLLELLSLTHLDHEQHATLGVVRESGKSLLRIIDDILDFSKIEAGKLDLVPEPASVREVVERVWRMYMGAASGKGLLLKRFYDARISPAVMADPVRLQQVLGNFVSNAIKFTPTGGASISAELIERAEGRDMVQFTVSDSGIGLAEEQQARLFQPFMQANDNVAAEYGGTGLGLAISRRIAAMMGGTIRMESEPGHGTRLIFTVPLPIAESEAKVAAGPAASKPIAVRKPPSVEEAERQRALVLVVDDHPVNRMVLLRQVNALGYAAETAEDGRDALGKWSTGRFAAVITDCNMPEMSGYELARGIRTREGASPHARTTIIACTANALGGEAEKCFAAGMDDYLAKPVALDQLAEKLAHCLPLAHRVNGSRPIDLEVLSEISGGDPELNRELLARFQRHNAEDAENLREAARQKDLAQLVAYSHRIKGASKTIGATGLALVCEEIERSGHAQDMDSLMSHLRRFDTEVERLDEYIRTDPGND